MRREKKRKNLMMQIAETLVAVHTHTHTHTQLILSEEKNNAIFAFINNIIKSKLCKMN